MLVVKCSRCGGESHLMDALREQGIGIGVSVLFGFKAEINETGEIVKFVPGSCINLGSTGYDRGDVPTWLLPVEIDDLFVEGPGTWEFQVWVEVGDREIKIHHNPDQAPVRVDTILTGLAEVFESPSVWTFDLLM